MQSAQRSGCSSTTSSAAASLCVAYILMLSHVNMNAIVLYNTTQWYKQATT